MKAHARSVAPALPYVTFCLDRGVKRHDSLTSALFYFEANNAVRNAYVKNRERWRTWANEEWEVWAESMVTGEKVYLGQVEKET